MSSQQLKNKDQRKKWATMLTQKESSYVTLSGTEQQACANCRWYSPNKIDCDECTPYDYCHLVESWPDDIIPTGWCNRWEGKPPEILRQEPMPVVIVAEVEESEDDVDEMDMRSAKSLFRRFVDWLTGVKQMDASGFKALDGNRFVVWYSNNYADDEGEIFPAAKIDEYIEKVKTGAYPYPTLQFAHLSGTDHGQTDNLWRVGNFVLATGKFADTPQAAKWKSYHDSLQRSGRKIGVSHRYWYSEKSMQDGVYGSFQTFEISWFPVVSGVKPANPFTAMEVKAMPVPITPELRADMKQYGFSDTEIDGIAATAQQLDARAIAERRAAKIEGGEEPTQGVPAVETPAPEPAVDVEKAIEAVEEKWQTAFKSYQDATAKTLEALTAAVTELTAKVNDGFALKRPASKSIWTVADDDDADVVGMLDAEKAAKKGKKKSVVAMMAGEGQEEMK